MILFSFLFIPPSTQPSEFLIEAIVLGISWCSLWISIIYLSIYWFKSSTWCRRLSCIGTSHPSLDDPNGEGPNQCHETSWPFSKLGGADGDCKDSAMPLGEVLVSPRSFSCNGLSTPAESESQFMPHDLQNKNQSLIMSKFYHSFQTLPRKRWQGYHSQQLHIISS